MKIGWERSEWGGENISRPGESRLNLSFGVGKFPVPRVLFDPLDAVLAGLSVLMSTR